MYVAVASWYMREARQGPHQRVNAAVYADACLLASFCGICRSRLELKELEARRPKRCTLWWEREREESGAPRPRRESHINFSHKLHFPPAHIQTVRLH